MPSVNKVKEKGVMIMEELRQGKREREGRELKVLEKQEE